MEELLSSKIEEVKTAQLLVIESLRTLIDTICNDTIPNLSKQECTEDVIKYAQMIDKLKNHKDEINCIFNKFDEITEYNDEEDEETSESKDITEDTIKRTDWTIDSDNVKVITTRPNPNNGAPYTNIIPINLFKEIIHTILEQFTRYNCTEITTGTINVIVLNKIVKESKYQKSPKNITYSIFKVLQKENILERGSNSTHYVLSKDEDYINNWLKKYNI